MKSLESWLLTYLLNSLWQVPLLFAAGWIAARALRSAGVAAEHRVWVCVLVLQSLLPACSTMPREWLRGLFAKMLFFWLGDTRPVDAHVSVVAGPGTVLGGVNLPSELLTAVAIAYAAAIAYFAARFAWRWKNLSVLRREAGKMPLNCEAAAWSAQCSASFGISGVSLATSSRIFGPVTVGFFRKLVLLPANMAASLPETELHAAIVHEFAHLHRNDFLKNLIYELLSLPVSYHPVLWLTRQRITETREMVCDAMAARISGRNEYARSLLRLASLLVDGMPGRTPHAIGILDAHIFERRIMNLTKNQNEIRGLRRVAIVLVCTALGIGTCASAMALSMHVDAASKAADKAPPHGPLNVSPGVMAGQKISGPVPKYPAAAKKARIQGTVVLDAVIGKDGTIENLTVVSGPPELQQSSLDAVRQWTYKPYLLNGDPVEVKTTINVIYSLSK